MMLTALLFRIEAESRSCSVPPRVVVAPLYVCGLVRRVVLLPARVKAMLADFYAPHRDQEWRQLAAA